MAITGKIKLYIFDELGDIGDVREWELHGDLEDSEELQSWKDMKLERIQKEYGDERWSETTGFEWDEANVHDPVKEEREEEARYKYFLEEIYPDLYPNEDWDPDDAYDEWLYAEHFRNQY